jgi:hypothetical protein
MSWWHAYFHRRCVFHLRAKYENKCIVSTGLAVDLIRLRPDPCRVQRRSNRFYAENNSYLWLEYSYRITMKIVWKIFSICWLPNTRHEKFYQSSGPSKYTHVLVSADDASVVDNTDKPFVDDGIFLSVFLFLTYRYHVYDLDQQWWIKKIYLTNYDAYIHHIDILSTPIFFDSIVLVYLNMLLLRCINDEGRANELFIVVAILFIQCLFTMTNYRR